MPTVAASELETVLAPLPMPDGAGPVAALATFRFRWANVFALDAAGRVLCVPGVDPLQPLAALGDGGLQNDGPAAFGAGGGSVDVVRRDVAGVADLVIGPDGTVYAVPTTLGEAIVGYRPPDLNPASELPL